MRTFAIALAMAGLFVPLIPSCAQAATVVIVSQPSGAEVRLAGSDMVYGKTPLRLNIDEGPCTVILRKQNYEDLRHVFAVGRKLVALKLQMIEKKYPVDFLFKDIGETDWWIVDYAVPTKLKCLGKVPGTAMLAKGRKRLVILKKGYRDIRVAFDVVGLENQVVELKDPQKGYSSFEKVMRHLISGVWEQTPNDPPGPRRFFLEASGRGCLKTPLNRTGYQGTWKIVDTMVEFYPTDERLLRVSGPVYKLRWNETVTVLQGHRRQDATTPGDWNLVKVQQPRK